MCILAWGSLGHMPLNHLTEKVFPATPHLWLLKAWVISLNFCLNSDTSSPNKFATDNGDGAWAYPSLMFLPCQLVSNSFPNEVNLKDDYQGGAARIQI